MASRRQSVNCNQFLSVLLNLPAKMCLNVKLANNLASWFRISQPNGLQLREKSTVSPIPDYKISLVIQQELLSFRPVIIRLVESIYDSKLNLSAPGSFLSNWAYATVEEYRFTIGRLRLAYFREPVNGGLMRGGDKQHITANRRSKPWSGFSVSRSLIRPAPSAFQLASFRAAATNLAQVPKYAYSQTLSVIRRERKQLNHH